MAEEAIGNIEENNIVSAECGSSHGGGSNATEKFPEKESLVTSCESQVVKGGKEKTVEAFKSDTSKPIAAQSDCYKFWCDEQALEEV